MSSSAYVKECDSGSEYDLAYETDLAYAKVSNWVLDLVSVKVYETLCEIPCARDSGYDSA